MAARDGTVLSSRAVAAGVFATAFGVLLLEIALTRIFSFTIWHHFTYLTISVALLGFGAAGSLLAAFPSLLNDPPKLLRRASLIAAAGVAVVLLVVSAVPLDPVAVLHDKQQLGNLILYYVVVAAPFFAAGLAIAGAIAAAPAQIARLYCWDLLGAGLACFLVVPLVWWLGTPMTVAVSATAFGAAAIAFSFPSSASQVALAAALATFTIAVGASVTFAPGSNKLMSVHFATGAQPIFHRWTPLDRVDVLAWDETMQDDRAGYRGWGASPRYDGPGLPFRMLGYDGDSCSTMYRWSGERDELEWLHHHVLAAPYVLKTHPRVLAIGIGGGTDVLNAIANDATTIVGVDVDPLTIALGAERYAAYNGGIFNRPEVTMVAADGRQYLRAHDERYDLLELNGVTTLSALYSAAYVLPESYLYTADAVGDYLGHLSPGGVFAMAVGDFNTPVWQPRNTLRMVANIRRALASRGADAPERHVVIVASSEPLAMTHMLVKNEPFTAEEITRLDAFVQAEGFDYWQRPDRRVAHDAALLLWGDDTERAAFYAKQDLNLGATTDESPFFFSFYKWRKLRWRAHEIDAGRTFATGQIVLVLMLVQSLVVAPLVILTPLLRLRRTFQHVSRRSGYVVYFIAVGLGFMLLEISFVQRFVLYLGQPTYALSVVLFSLLCFTGLGSLLSTALRPRPERALPAMLGALAAMAITYLIALQPIFHLTFGAPLSVRVGITVALVAPLGLVLGTFFPLGIALLTAVSPRFVPWAWSITGCAAVVGTVVAVIVAISWDFRAVTLLALAVYAAGVGAMLWARRALPAGSLTRSTTTA